MCCGGIAKSCSAQIKEGIPTSIVDNRKEDWGSDIHATARVFEIRHSDDACSNINSVLSQDVKTKRDQNDLLGLQL